MYCKYAITEITENIFAIVKFFLFLKFVFHPTSWTYLNNLMIFLHLNNISLKLFAVTCFVFNISLTSTLVVNYAHIHIPFWLNTTLLTYCFWKCWQQDPGYP